jgi:hypothetical protein
VFLSMNSNCTNYVDPHTIIIIFLIFWLYFMFFLTDGFVLLYIRFSPLTFLLFYLLYFLDYLIPRVWKDQNMPLPTTIQTDDDIL